MSASFSHQEQQVTIAASQRAKRREIIVRPKKGPLRRAAQVREETPKVGCNIETLCPMLRRIIYMHRTIRLVRNGAAPA